MDSVAELALVRLQVGSGNGMDPCVILHIELRYEHALCSASLSDGRSG